MKKYLFTLLLLGFFFTGKTRAQTSPPGSCFFWFGIENYNIGARYITVNWRDGTALYYRVYYYDFWNNNGWIQSGGNITGLSQQIVGLEPSHDYVIMVVRYCANGSSEASNSLGNIRTLASDPPYCPTPGNPVAQNITTNSARLMANVSYSTLNMTTTFYIYYKPETATTSQVVTYPAPANPNLFSWPTITGLTPGTKYMWQLGQYCYSWYTGATTSYSPVGYFSTLDPPPGPCGCKVGNYTATSIANESQTYFYCGNITSASSVAQSSNTVTFEGTEVLMNPGFIATATGNGAYKAVVFTPSNCNITGRSANGESVAGEIIPETEPGSINLFPNPTHGTVTIRLPQPGEVIRRLILTDISGRKLMDINKPGNQVNIGELANGIYLYSVQTNEKTYTGKLVKY